MLPPCSLQGQHRQGYTIGRREGRDGIDYTSNLLHASRTVHTITLLVIADMWSTHHMPHPLSWWVPDYTLTELDRLAAL